MRCAQSPSLPVTLETTYLLRSCAYTFYAEIALTLVCFQTSISLKSMSNRSLVLHLAHVRNEMSQSNQNYDVTEFKVTVA